MLEGCKTPTRKHINMRKAANKEGSGLPHKVHGSVLSCTTAHANTNTHVYVLLADCRLLSANMEGSFSPFHRPMCCLILVAILMQHVQGKAIGWTNRESISFLYDRSCVQTLTIRHWTLRDWELPLSCLVLEIKNRRWLLDSVLLMVT